MAEHRPDVDESATYVTAWRKDLGALGSLLTGEAVARGIGQVALLITARVLGPDDFGLVAVALTVFGIVAVLADLGLGETAAARLTHSLRGAVTFAAVVAPIRFRASLALGAVMLGAAVLTRGSPTVSLACLAALAVPGSIAITGRVFAARIRGDFPAAARWTVLNGLCLWLGPLAGALIFRSALAAVGGLVVAATLAAALTRAAHPHARTTWRVSGAWLRVASPILFSALAVAVYSRVDRLFIAAAEGPAAVGIYAAAYNVVMLVAVVGSTVQAGLLPRLIHESSGDTRTLWRRRLLVVIAVMSGFALALWVIAPWLISILYGPEFAASAEVLRWLSPLVVLYVATPFLSATLMSRRQSHAIAVVSGVNLAVSLVLYPLTIGALGVTGAAMTSVIVELVGLAQQSVWLVATDRESA